MNEHYVIELIEDFNSKINDRVYLKGRRFIAWLDGKSYRVANNDLDFIPLLITKQIYKVRFEEA